MRSFSFIRSVFVRRRGYVLVYLNGGVDVLVDGLQLALAALFEDELGDLIVVICYVVVEDLPTLSETLFCEAELVFPDEALG